MQIVSFRSSFTVLFTLSKICILSLVSTKPETGFPLCIKKIKRVSLLTRPCHQLKLHKKKYSPSAGRHRSLLPRISTLRLRLFLFLNVSSAFDPCVCGLLCIIRNAPGPPNCNCAGYTAFFAEDLNTPLRNAPSVGRLLDRKIFHNEPPKFFGTYYCFHYSPFSEQNQQNSSVSAIPDRPLCRTEL